MDNQNTPSDPQLEARIALHKHYLQGRLLAVVAEAVGQVTPVNQAQISELVDSCEPGMRYREELSQASIGVSLSSSCASALDLRCAAREDR